jgi:alpha,alpha-trehalase
MRLDAAILDMDGVLTRTATLHEQAWKEMFDAVLRETGDSQPFSSEDYSRYVDGKPRMDGLRDFLSSRDIDLPEQRLDALAQRKNEIYRRSLRGGVEVFGDAVRTVGRWRSQGLGIAFVSSSRNASEVLEAADLDQLCDVQIDGETAAREGLAGKLEMFRAAAERLETEPSKAFVVEDAPAGVEAGVEAGFALVVGVARDGNGKILEEHGATRIVRSLDELSDVVEPGSRPAHELPSALNRNRLAARTKLRLPVVLLDFDGTLSPIVEQPDDAAMPEAVHDLVRRLAERCTVAIVSGRDREDVARRVRLPNLWYVGSHGFDIASPDGEIFTREEAEPALPELERAEEEVRNELAGIDGIVIERKAFALAVHYRLASRQGTEKAIGVVQSIARRSDHLTTHSDLLVIELRADVDWHKGHAIDQILATLDVSPAEAVPIYVGDGRTDEDAFLTLKERGIAVLVGSPRRPTHAHLRLEGQEEVAPFLEALIHLADNAQAEESAWTLRFEGWNPDEEPLREALCTLGNGKFATRAAAEEAAAGEVHYPGTYLGGGYNRIATERAGEILVNEDLVNWPNWLPLTFRPEGGEWLSLKTFEVLDFSQTLDLRRGLMTRDLRVRDRDGRTTRLVSRRIVSMDDPSVGALQWELTPEDWSGSIEIRSSLDGTVQNRGVERYRQLRGDHLVPFGVGRLDSETVWLRVQTRQSSIRMAQVARTRTWGGGELRTKTADSVDRIDHYLTLDVSEGNSLRVEKVVVIQSSRDAAISNALDAARNRMKHLPDFESLLIAHARRWGQLWHRCDLRLGDGQQEETRILRLHIFHLLQVASPHIFHFDVGVPARGLHGEAYRGHIFWDELFIFPFLNFRLPDLTRELLMYRYLRLDAARQIARELGYEGAVYPWQSGSSGREESQVLHLNPKSGRWVPDETLTQRHIGSAVAWNVWQYFKTTADYDFLSFYGAEMILEVARFWASIATFDEELDRYRIRGVMGPDEFHTRYPDSDRPGLDDNAYTNVMAAWCLRTAERALEVLTEDRAGELLEHLGISGEERVRWQRIASRLRVVFQDEHIISQFDGYADLEEFDWDRYRKQHGDIHRLDRILEAEDDTPNRYKASKQADVLMLFFLFTSEELIELLASMGYHFEQSWIRENVEYYLARTSHGSTLSHVIHSWVLARHDRAGSWQLFQDALRADVEDIQGGTTPEGIHLGAMAATVDLVQRGYTGMTVRQRVLWFDPRLPDEMSELCLRLRFRGSWLDLQITHDAVEVEISVGEPTVRIGICGVIYDLSRGRSLRVDIRRPEQTDG